CQKNAAEIGEALSRALDRPISASIGEAGPWDSKLATGPGLVIVLEVESAATILLLPAHANLIPTWYSEPDATGRSKLATLAQELGMLLLPDAFSVGDSAAFAVDDLAAAVERGQIATDANAIAITLTADGQQQT